MTVRRPSPPLDYLHAASKPSLESYELSRLNHAANLRREIAALVDQWIEETAQALLARWILEERALQPAENTSSIPPQPRLPFDDLAVPQPSLRAARPLKLPRRCP
jgi:hypothetical protein